MINESLPGSGRKSKQIAEETQKDPSLQRVIKLLKEEWPRGDLSVIKGLLLRNNRIINPHALRPEMLKRLLEGNLGMEKCKRRVRTAIYWPGISADIDRMVSSCDSCLKHQAKRPRAHENHTPTG